MELGKGLGWVGEGLRGGIRVWEEQRVGFGDGRVARGRVWGGAAGGVWGLGWTRPAYLCPHSDSEQSL